MDDPRRLVGSFIMIRPIAQTTVQEARIEAPVD